jgi:electron transfer flavoprotein beta subunit
VLAARINHMDSRMDASGGNAGETLMSSKIRIASDGKGVDTNVKHSMVSPIYPNEAGAYRVTGTAKPQNPFDEIAVEEAIRLRERDPKSITSITALSIGPAKSVDTIRTSLAMGADAGIHITTPEGTIVEPIAVANAIKAVIDKRASSDKDKIGLVIMGKQAIDDDSGSTGGMLAGLLGWGQACFASKLEVKGDKAEVTREIDGGLEKVESALPLIVTTDLRYVHLRSFKADAKRTTMSLRYIDGRGRADFTG